MKLLKNLIIYEITSKVAYTIIGRTNKAIGDNKTTNFRLMCVTAIATWIDLTKFCTKIHRRTISVEFVYWQIRLSRR